MVLKSVVFNIKLYLRLALGLGQLSVRRHLRFEVGEVRSADNLGIGTECAVDGARGILRVADVKMSGQHGGGGDSVAETPVAPESGVCPPEEPSSKDEGVKDVRQKEDQAISTAIENRRVQRISSDLRGVVRW